MINCYKIVRGEMKNMFGRCYAMYIVNEMQGTWEIKAVERFAETKVGLIANSYAHLALLLSFLLILCNILMFPKSLEC